MGGKSGGMETIPAEWRKTVEGLKEIVKCSEQEIYAMLKECDMDPNDAVQRLLSQDTFHEVKRKREKRKEIKETQESRSRGNGSASNLGARGGSDRNVGCNRPIQISSYDKREYGSIDPPLFLSYTSRMAGNNMNQQPKIQSDSGDVEYKKQAIGTGHSISSSVQPCPGLQPACLGVAGHVSMVDIVKMGRRQGKASNLPTLSVETSYPPLDAVALDLSDNLMKDPHDSAPSGEESHQDLDSQNPSSVSEMIHDPCSTASQTVFYDEWPSVEQVTSASGLSVLDASAASDTGMQPKSNLLSDGAKLSLNCQSNGVRVSKIDVAVEILNTDHIKSASASCRQIIVDSDGGSSHFSSDSHQDVSSSDSHRHAFEHQEGIGDGPRISFQNHAAPLTNDVSEAVSLAASNLQQLSLWKEELAVPSRDDDHVVLIPDHLKVSDADCSHLSFGTFRTGRGSAFSGPLASGPLRSGLKAGSVAAANGTSVGHLDTRKTEYHDDDQLIPMSSAHRAALNDGIYNPPLPELLKPDDLEATLGHQYAFSSSIPDYILDDNQSPNSALPYVQAKQQMRNLSSFARGMNSDLLASAIQSMRESDLSYSPLLATQSMPTKYSALSSISSLTISMPEVLKSGSFSVPQPALQRLTDTSIATGPALAQHFAVHPYSQPSLPSRHSADMIGFPSLPQGYAYMTSTLQQAHQGSSPFHQSPVAVESPSLKYNLPQCESDLSVGSLRQYADITSGYGGFGRSFLRNPSTAPASTTIGYDDILSSQFKDRNHYNITLQQNDSPAMWVHGAGSRTMSAVPESTHNSLQGQNQPHAEYRLSQQHPQQFGALEHPNFHHSRIGITQEHQRQSPSDGFFGGSQGLPSNQSHCTWQHIY